MLQLQFCLSKHSDVLPFGASGSNSIYCLKDGPGEVVRAVGADGGEIQMSMGNLFNDGYDGDTHSPGRLTNHSFFNMQKTMKAQLSTFNHHQIRGQLLYTDICPQSHNHLNNQLHYFVSLKSHRKNRQHSVSVKHANNSFPNKCRHL